MQSLTITWRDEAYGRYCGCTAAFRLYDTVDLPDCVVQRIAHAARRAGFEFSDARCAWLTYASSAPVHFVEGLQALGLTVHHDGRWPEGPPPAEGAP